MPCAPRSLHGSEGPARRAPRASRRGEARSSCPRPCSRSRPAGSPTGTAAAHPSSCRRGRTPRRPRPATAARRRGGEAMSTAFLRRGRTSPPDRSARRAASPNPADSGSRRSGLLEGRRRRDGHGHAATILLGQPPARARMSRALDPRLLRHARATRRFMVVSVALGCVAALLIVAQAWLIAYVVAGAFLGGHDPDQLGVPMAVLGGVVLARAAVAWAAELAAARASAQAKSQLRAELLVAGAELAVKGDPRVRSGEVATLASRGVDALDGYFSQYLPQLV